MTSRSIYCDVRLATSDDGNTFAKMGIVLGYEDTNVWGFGDELFPIGVFFTDVWNLFYVAKDNVSIFLQTGLATGNTPAVFDSSVEVAGTGPEETISGGQVFRLTETEYALAMVRPIVDHVLEFRAFSPSSPGQLGAVVESYGFADRKHHAPFLDCDTDTWFLYSIANDDSSVLVMTAPVTYAM